MTLWFSAIALNRWMEATIDQTGIRPYVSPAGTTPAGPRLYIFPPVPCRYIALGRLALSVYQHVDFLFLLLFFLLPSRVFLSFIV